MRTIFESDPMIVLEVVGPTLNRSPTLRTMPLDLEPDGRLEFEDLAGLFASTSLNHGLVGMTIRGGSVLFDDAFDEPLFPTHSDTVGRLVAEIAEEGAFELEAQVDRLAHLVRRR